MNKDALILLHSSLGDLEMVLRRKCGPFTEPSEEDVKQVQAVEALIERLVKELP